MMMMMSMKNTKETARIVHQQLVSEKLIFFTRCRRVCKRQFVAHRPQKERKVKTMLDESMTLYRSLIRASEPTVIVNRHGIFTLSRTGSDQIGIRLSSCTTTIFLSRQSLISDSIRTFSPRLSLTAQGYITYVVDVGLFALSSGTDANTAIIDD